jgi:GH18 family chitinase
LIGQSVRLVFSAANNATLATVFRVDDVNLNAVSPATSNRVVGYLPEYRYSSFAKVDLSALTHLNYFALGINDDGSLTFTNTNAAHLDTVVAASHAAGVGVSITVGPDSFSVLAASATARAACASNVVAYALAHNLDGIDIDWEPPAGNNNANYTNLINDLYTQAHPQHMVITAAVNPWTNEIPAATVNSKMDWLNVMCYSFSYANHTTYADTISGMVDWKNFGVTKNKLVMGIPFYGKQGTSWSDDTSITYTALSSDYLANHGAYPAPDLDLADGWYFNGIETIRKKMQYVVDNAYGGAMIWEVGQDHWNASSQYDVWSMLPVMKSVILATGAIGTISTTPADNAYAPLSQTQHVSVTVNANVASSGVLQVSLVGVNATTPRDWFHVSAAGSVSHTFTLPVSQSTAGSQFYEIYVQFRPNVNSGPLTYVDDSDALKLQPYHLNWQQFPSAPTTPNPSDNATLASAPSLFDWADAANATSYDVYVDGVLRQNVASSQWTRNITITPNVAHTWQVIAKNTYGSVPGATWNFTIVTDVAPPTVQSGSHSFENNKITLTASESLATSSVGNANATLTAGGSAIDLGAGSVVGNQVTYNLPTSLPDGDYTFHLPAGAIRDLAGNLLASEWTMTFWTLVADANRDRKVDTSDFNLLAANFGGASRVFSQGNFDYDAAGVVNSTDFNLLVAQYGKKLPAPAMPLGTSSAASTAGPLFCTTDHTESVFTELQI